MSEGEEPSSVGGTALARVRLYVLLALAALAVYVVGAMLWPFLPAIVTSAVLATLVYPLHERFERRVRNKDMAALLGTLGVFFLVLLPLLALSVVLLNEIQAAIVWLTQEAPEFLAPDGTLARWLASAAAYLGVDEPRLSAALGQQVQQLSLHLAGRTVALLTGLGGWLLQAVAAIFTLYYLLRDADGLMRVIKWAIPLEREQTERIVGRTREVIHATVFGNVVIAVVQGVLGGVAFWLLGLPAAALWGTTMGLLSLLPVVGPVMVWLPAAVILLALGQVAKSMALVLLGTLVVSNIDNVLRPLLVSGRASLHPLVVFFSILGGAFVFGAVGILVGPVLFAIALSVIEMGRVALETGGRYPPAPGVLLPRQAAAGESRGLLGRLLRKNEPTSGDSADAREASTGADGPGS